MVTFVCVNVGNYQGRGAEYVNILCNMIARNLPEQHKYVCFTDDPTGISSEIECRLITEQLNGWWNKLYMFKPSSLTSDDGRVIYVDLDTVILSSLDEIVKYAGKFAILRDFYRPNGLQSSFMMWEGGDHNYIWNNWIAAGKPEINGGDQAWVEIYFQRKNRDILQQIYPQCFVSYRVHCLEIFPKTAKVVCFHGADKPHNTHGWVDHIWKIDGGSALELVNVGNTKEETLIENIKHSLTLPNPLLQRLEPHDGVAAVVGGGPSLKTSYIPPQYTIFATNNSWRLLDRFDYHVMLDARPENAQFIPSTGKKFYASQVWPGCITEDVTIWHSYADGIQEIIKDEPRETVYVGGGSSVGLKTLVIAFLLGYRKIHLYGFDSSYEEDSHHAYPQALNDGERVIDVVCNDKEYRAAPWMVTQVEEFKDLAAMLVAEGCEITVHGSGLLPDIAKEMGKDDPLMWPKGDIEGKYHGVREVHNIPAIVFWCKKTNIIIQAGGNVGLWPQAYSEIFKQVYTFEPDPLNYECLLKNCTAPNVNKFNMALGDKGDWIDIHHEISNCGASYVSGEGKIQISRLDDLNFGGCDLLQLDIEGYELMALKGAENTIKTYSPTICVEFNSAAARYGVSFDDIAVYLRTFGYKLVERIGNDYIFIKEG